MWEKCQYSAPAEKKKKKSVGAGAAGSCSHLAMELNSLSFSE